MSVLSLVFSFVEILLLSANLLHLFSLGLVPRIPGVVLAIRMMEPMGGPKPLQAWGFVAIAAASLLLLCFYAFGEYIGHFWAKWCGFISCCLLIGTLNWGCNVSVVHVVLLTHDFVASI